jgi:putative beta-lysine N-acetyltransferase
VSDILARLGDSLIQHGKHNDRVYLMKLSPSDYPAILSGIEELVAEHRYTKVFAKVPESCAEEFLRHGYQIEAQVPDFYWGKIRALFLAKYYSESRKAFPEQELQNVRELVRTTAARREVPEPGPFRVAPMAEPDAAAMAELYRRVFPSYPFPIDRPEYLRETMAGETFYFGIRDCGRLIALSSAETDREYLNAEMTDFAVLPEYRGSGLAGLLLRQMEEAAQRLGIKTAYTIARLKSAGMNVTFLKSGYSYTGTLINNTQIAGGFESMNVLYKKLAE